MEGHINLETFCCGECKVLFWLSDVHCEVLKREHTTFYCPNGHARVFAGKTNAQIAKELEEQIQTCKSTIENLIKENEHLKHSNDRYKAQYKRKEKPAETEKRD